MRRRLLLGLSLVGAFGLGLLLAVGPFPDALRDLWNDLLVAWYGYKLRAGSGGTFYVMVAGFLLGEGLFLAARQLWRGPLRSARGRFADLDAARDLTTGLPSRFGLERFLDRTLRWNEGDPSTRHVSLAFFQVQGIEALNARAGTLAGTQILLEVAGIVRDGAVPLSVTGPLRWWARLRLGPRLALFGRNPPSRCPARWGGATFALAFRGVDGRKALVVTRELVADLHAWVRRLAPDSPGLGVKGGLCLHSAGASVAELARGAARALEAAPAGGIAAAHQAGEGSAAMLDEFKDLTRVQVTFAPSARAAAVEEPRGAGTLAVAWLKRWGIALAGLAGGPVLLSATARGAEATVLYPWPESLKELPVVDASGMQAAKLVRMAARPASDPLWTIERARAVQVAPESERPPQTTVFVQLAIVNRSDRTQHVSMFDVSALDGDGRQLRLEAKTSLAMENPLRSRDLEPGGRWTGWLRFIRSGTGARALVFHPSRATRIYLPLEPEASPPTPGSALTAGPH